MGKREVSVVFGVEKSEVWKAMGRGDRHGGGRLAAGGRLRYGSTKTSGRTRRGNNS